MYECPNCAANLKFHIGKQQLFCEHCETTMDPYSFQKEQDAEESKYYEVTIFTCPQCGGELLTEDTTAATFCSYCGGSTILDSRISKEKKPTYILPFSQTEEHCKKAYVKISKKAFLAPNELKDAAHIEKFRGIYMPYWIYSFHKNGEAHFKGEEEKYSVVKHYDVKCPVSASYEDILFDASSTFYDNLSSTIAPFNLIYKKPFTPTYLSGFYADSGDIESSVYQKDAEDLVMKDVSALLGKNQGLSKFKVAELLENASMSDTLKPETEKAELALLPVWFLAYRKKNRVAYAVVNGQTGEAAADFPIDIKKYFIASLLLTIPIFLLLNLLFTMTPPVFLGFCGVIASLFAILLNNMTNDILLKESVNDWRLLKAQEVEQKRRKEKFTTFIIGTIVVLFQLPFLIGLIWVLIEYEHYVVLLAAAIVIFMLYLLSDLKTLKKPNDPTNTNLGIYEKYWKRKLFMILKPILAIIISMITIFVNPVSDLYFYGCGILCIGILIWCACDIVSCHNLMTTRKLPQLNKRGGDDYE